MKFIFVLSESAFSADGHRKIKFLRRFNQVLSHFALKLYPGFFPSQLLICRFWLPQHSLHSPFFSYYLFIIYFYKKRQQMSHIIFGNTYLQVAIKTAQLVPSRFPAAGVNPREMPHFPRRESCGFGVSAPLHLQKIT